MSPPNLLPLLGAILAGFLASFALVREPVSPQASASESPIAVAAADSGIAQLVSQSGAARASENASGRLAERLATSFIGRSIDSRDGDTFGEVKDLVLDEGGRVTHAILSYGGVGGLGARQVALPWQALKDRIRGDRIVLDRARLEAAPTLPEDDPDLTGGDWSREIDRYWERIRSTLGD